MYGKATKCRSCRVVCRSCTGGCFKKVMCYSEGTKNSVATGSYVVEFFGGGEAPCLEKNKTKSKQLI